MTNTNDVILYELVKKKSKILDEQCSSKELKNILKKWADSHPELENDLEELNESYTVRWIDESNKTHEKTFERRKIPNPFCEARFLYMEILDQNPIAIELWLNPNAYKDGILRNGKIINYSSR